MGKGWKIATFVLTALVVTLGATSGLLWHHLHGGPSSADDGGPLSHVSNEFEFVLHAPMAQVAPLFGADRERVWSKEWAPEFLYPSATVGPATALPAAAGPRDVEGAVFRVSHGKRKVPWVNTVFDLPGGHISYVYFIDTHLVTRIDIHLTAQTADDTGVKVLYERTALSPAANDHVVELGKSDAGAGPDWQAELEKYLKASADAAPAATTLPAATR